MGGGEKGQDYQEDLDDLYQDHIYDDYEDESNIAIDGFRGCGCDGVCKDGSIVMLCRSPVLNTRGFFDKTFKEYKKGFAGNGEGWLGLEKLHQLTKKGLYRLKVSLTDRSWNEYVGYWDWIKIGAGKGYKLTLGQFLTAYSTLGDALSPDPCGGPRAANMNFSAKDLDQDADNTTHCANATLLTSASGSTWKRGGWWHAGAQCSMALLTAPTIYWWWNGGPTGSWPLLNGRDQLGSSNWAKGEMRLIPVKCPEIEPFEPSPPHNQTMLTNATMKAVVLPTCPPASRYTWPVVWG